MVKCKTTAIPVSLVLADDLHQPSAGTTSEGQGNGERGTLEHMGDMEASWF